MPEELLSVTPPLTTSIEYRRLLHIGEQQQKEKQTVDHLRSFLTLLCVGVPWACCVHARSLYQPYSGGAVGEDPGGGLSHRNPGGREAWVPVPLC